MKKVIFITFISILTILLIGFLFYLNQLNKDENNVTNSGNQETSINFNNDINNNNMSKSAVNNIVKSKIMTDQGLQKKADSLLKLFDNMSEVPIYLTDELILKEGSNVEKGLAYTFCIEEGKPEIFIKKVFYQQRNDNQITNVLKHELTHAWQCNKGIMSGHNEEFWKKFHSIGGFGN